MTDSPSLSELFSDNCAKREIVHKEILHNFLNYKMLAFSYVRDMSVAEDIISDVCMKLYEKEEFINDFSCPLDIKKYIVKCIKNKCIDWIKVEKRRKEIHRDILDDAMGHLEISLNSLESTDIDNLIFSKEVMSILHNELQSCAEITRKVFVSSRILGMTNKEISAKFSLSERRVKWEITKMLRRLRIALKDYMIVFILFL